MSKLKEVSVEIVFPGPVAALDGVQLLFNRFAVDAFISHDTRGGGDVIVKVVAYNEKRAREAGMLALGFLSAKGFNVQAWF